MEYTIDKLAKLTGVSKRTLRFYEEEELLEPVRRSASGYRIYGQKEVDRLQQILFYKALGFSLDKIKEALKEDGFDFTKALKKQRDLLLEKQKNIESLLLAVESSLKYQEGKIKMSDQEKFLAFKKERLAENEANYGKEIREKYGEEVIERTNEKYLHLSQEEMKKMGELEQDLFAQLALFKKNPDLNSHVAKKIYEDHRDWLSFSWEKYDKKAHLGLVTMYLVDERFKKYYDKVEEGFTQLLYDCVSYYTN